MSIVVKWLIDNITLATLSFHYEFQIRIQYSVSSFVFFGNKIACISLTSLSDFVLANLCCTSNIFTSFVSFLDVPSTTGFSTSVQKYRTATLHTKAPRRINLPQSERVHSTVFHLYSVCRGRYGLAMNDKQRSQVSLVLFLKQLLNTSLFPSYHVWILNKLDTSTNSN